MALPKRQSALIDEISKKYGGVIDLKKSPGVLVEILLNYGRALDPPEGGGGTGGVSPSSIAVAGPPPAPPPTVKPGEGGDVMLADVMRAVLNLQRDVNTINKAISQKAVQTVKAVR